MLTNKITGFSADLLNTVRGILGEAKKCPADCECEKCEAEEMKEGSMPTADEPTDANKKTADKVRAMLAKEKKLKEDIMEMVNEASDGLSDKAKKSGIPLSTLKKVYARGIAAWNSGHRPGTTPQQWAHARVNSYITKGKGTYGGADKDLHSESHDMPFEGPYKKVGDRKDEYGNKVKNVAKYLAKKAMNKTAKANEEVEQVDEISADMAYRYLKGKRERDYDISADGKSSKTKKPQTFSKMNKDAKSSRLALRTIEKAKKTNEEVENLDETAKIVAHLQKRYGDNIRKSHVRSAANDFGVDASKLAKAVRTKLGKNMLDEEQIDEISTQTVGSYREKAYAQQPAGDDGSQLYKKRKAGRDMAFKKVTRGAKVMAKEEHEEDDGWYTHSQMHGSKKSEKHPKGISAAEWKSGIRWHHGKNKRINIKEEVEQIDELSPGLVGRYINKAADRMSTQGVTAGLKIAADEKSKKNFDNIAKRQKGISIAVSKLTKEEQDFVDSLNNEIFEKADPYDIAGMIKKAKAKNDPNHPAMKHVAAIEDIKKHGGALSVQGDHVRSLIKALGEEAEITEARGRPKKGVAKDFTIHPKTKEKLMHNNPEHMKKIEVLQKNKVLAKPKAEADEHIMNQLQKAKTSMLGGSKINFTHGDSKQVSGTHAAKILSKYAGMKPDEKEAFQKFVGHSHENLMKHV